MKKEFIKKITSSILILSLAATLVACGDKQKEIVISKDVKKESKIEDATGIKLEKVKELNIKDSKYIPLCWKDDSNIVAAKEFVKKDDKNKDKKPNSDISIYNINTNTSKISKVKAINDIDLFGGLNGVQNQNNMGNKKLIYRKKNKIYTYNLDNNSTKEIYDLSWVKSGTVSGGFAQGSDRYVDLIQWSYPKGESEQIIVIIDLKTGKVVKSTPFKKLDLDSDFIYSKAKDVFYLSSPNEELFEYKLSSPNYIKKVRKIKGSRLWKNPVSKDGKYIYLDKGLCIHDDKDSECSVLKYDVLNDKVTTLLKSKVAKGKGYNYVNINLCRANNLVSYYNLRDRNLYDAIWDKINFIAIIEGDKIKNIEKFSRKTLGNIFAQFDSILFNQKGTKFIYQDSELKEDNKTLNTHYYIYQVKKK